jgi:nitrogen fixation-related uncharacterized protein
MNVRAQTALEYLLIIVVIVIVVVMVMLWSVGFGQESKNKMDGPTNRALCGLKSCDNDLAVCMNYAPCDGLNPTCSGPNGKCMPN